MSFTAASFPSRQVRRPALMSFRRFICTTLLMLPVVLCASGCKDTSASMDKMRDSTQQLIDYFTGHTPLVAAKKMMNQQSADERRTGVNDLVDRKFAQKPPYTTEYEHMAKTDPDWLVRATAIRALNRSRDASATPIFIAALNDSSDQVRLEAAKALVNVPDPKAAGPLTKIVNDRSDNRDVRIA